MRGEKVNLYVCHIDKTDTLKHDYKVNRYRRGEVQYKKITASSKAVIPFQLNTPPPTAA